MRYSIVLGIFLAGCGVADNDAPRELSHELVIDVVGARGDPDWFVVANATDGTLFLGDYVFVDAEGELDRAARFPAITLAAGERHLQLVTDQDSGFKLASDEALWIYRDCDGEPSDTVDWGG